MTIFWHWNVLIPFLSLVVQVFSQLFGDSLHHMRILVLLVDYQQRGYRSGPYRADCRYDCSGFFVELVVWGMNDYGALHHHLLRSLCDLMHHRHQKHYDPSLSNYLTLENIKEINIHCLVFNLFIVQFTTSFEDIPI